MQAEKYPEFMFDLETDDHSPYWGQEHVAFREEVRRFLRFEVQPLWHLASDERFPWDARRAAAQAELSGTDISRQYGGRELDCVSQGIAYEECGRLDVNTRELIGSGHARMIDSFGTPQLKQERLPKVISGEALIGCAITEEGAGSDIRAIQTQAIRTRSGYEISGTKAHVSRTHEADAFIVFAKTAEDFQRNSLTAFVVDMKQRGIARHDLQTMGMRGWSYGNIAFSAVEVPEYGRLGGEGQGFKIFEQHFGYWRTLVTLLCLGAAEQSVMEGIAYAKERNAFGGPIAGLSPVMHSLSEQASRLYAARLLCYQTLWLEDQGHRPVAEAAMNKWLGTTVAFEAVNAVMQVFGARGYETSSPLEKRLRDIRGLMLADGSNDVMKSLVGRELFGKDFYNRALGRDVDTA